MDFTRLHFIKRNISDLPLHARICLERDFYYSSYPVLTEYEKSTILGREITYALKNDHIPFTCERSIVRTK